MSLRILSAKDVEALIAMISLDELVGQTARLFYSSSTCSESQLIQCPPRTTVEMPGWTLLTMPAYVAGQGMSVKLVGVPQANNGPYRDLFEASSRSNETKLKNPALVDDGDHSKSQKAGLPATTIVVEEKSGNVKSIINARHLTALRTAAGSLLATELLLLGASSSSHTAAPHEADGGERTGPKTLVLFGAGLQIQYHAELLLARFPTIQCCHIINRRKNERGSQLWSRLMDRYGQTKKITLSGLYGDDGADETRPREEGKGLQESASDHARSHSSIRLVDATAAARSKTLEGDIVCFATSASEPLATADWIKEGAHLILVGSYTRTMHEVSTDLIKRASKIVVDSREHCMLEAGELIDAELDGERDLVELGELVDSSGKPLAARIAAATQGSITCFKSVGLAMQDVMIATLVTTHAEAHSVGTLIPDFD